MNLKLGFSKFDRYLLYLIIIHVNIFYRLYFNSYLIALTTKTITKHSLRDCLK